MFAFHTVPVRNEVLKYANFVFTLMHIDICTYILHGDAIYA